MKLSEKILTKNRKNTAVKFTLYLLDPDRGEELAAAIEGKEGEEARRARKEFVEANADMKFVVTRLSEVEVQASREDATAKLTNSLSAEGRKEVYDGDKGKFMIDYARALWPKVGRHVQRAEERGDDGEWKPLDGKKLQAVIESITSEYTPIQQFLVNEYLTAVSEAEEVAEREGPFTSGAASSTGS